MPEGVEVTLSRNFLRLKILKKNITGMNLYPSGRYRSKPPKGYNDFKNLVENFNILKINNIEVKGKLMWWQLLTPSQELYLTSTYGMSGQWRTKKSKHAAYNFTFDDSSEIFFEDIRHFGTVAFLSRDQMNKKLKSIGPDMLNNPPDLEKFKLRLSKYSEKTLPEVLMNQKIISGVGNYIKAEALYRSKLSPHRTIDSLNDLDFSNLYNSIKLVMKKSYQEGGASIQSFTNPNGQEGYATKSFLVYKHKKDGLGNLVLSEETKDKRTTWWVPEVQK